MGISHGWTTGEPDDPDFAVSADELNDHTGMNVHDHTDADSGGELDAAAITTGVIDIARIASGTPDGTKFVRDDGVLAVPAGAGTPARTEAVLGADVTMTTANTEYDGPTLTPAAGVYDVDAYAMIGTGTANVITAIVGRLKYGSTVVDERQGYEYVGNDFGYPVTIPLKARVTADGSTAIKISATADKASAVIMRDPFNNSSGIHRATLLVLIKVG